MHYTGKVFIDRNHAGTIMGLAPETDRKHDLEFVCDIALGNHGDVEANAERMAACWNACQGISTEALNAGIVPRLVWSHREMIGLVKSKFTRSKFPEADDVVEATRGVVEKRS